jgi:hypothetical protein
MRVSAQTQVQLLDAVSHDMLLSVWSSHTLIVLVSPTGYCLRRGPVSPACMYV